MLIRKVSPAEKLNGVVKGIVYQLPASDNSKDKLPEAKEFPFTS